MTPPAGPDAENRRQSQYAMLLLAIIALALAATAILAQDAYEHPTRAADCTAIQQYAATCSRAATPESVPPASGVPLYLGTLAAAILAVLLVEAGWRASVTRQEAIVTAFANSASAQPPSAASTTVAPAAVSPTQAPAQTAPTATAPAAQATAPTVSARKGATAHPVAGEDPDALRRPAPTTIHANTLAPGMVKAPTATPRAGVDPAAVEAKK